MSDGGSALAGEVLDTLPVDQVASIAEDTRAKLSAYVSQVRALCGLVGDAAAEALQKLGIATRQSNGESRETGAVLLDTIKALSGVANQAERTSLQNQILGRGSKEIAPLIAGYKDFSAAADRSDHAPAKRDRDDS